jgi:peptide chain release factor 3
MAYLQDIWRQKQTSGSTMSLKIEEEVKRRRTFAIISHPDAGKTTLTEKLLLYSGMLRTAGMVSGRKGSKAAASDWMSMEQERGISISSSSMQFEYKGHKINVLDTPGHQDFSEDTYRTLTAADSVIMVIDSSKGIETQTVKLFEACRLRNIPVITFVNKMDLYGRDPIDLMEEVENVLGIKASAVNWPIGSGKEFQGIVDRETQKCHFYTKIASGGSLKPTLEIIDVDKLTPRPNLSEAQIIELQESIMLLDEAGNPFSREEYINFKVTPVFFGSAMSNFGVEPLFDALINLAPSPWGRKATTIKGEDYQVDPVTGDFSAFVFKLQANMNPKHRDCIAFLRINAGTYEKDMTVIHSRTGKKIRLSSSHTLMAAERFTVEEAFPGDVIGINNTNGLAIGDTISVKGGFNFAPLPQFQPELFARITPTDLGKRKSIDKGLTQLASEGTVQLLYEWRDSYSYPFVAAVGRLQFEVLQHRLKEEYSVETRLENLPYSCSAWLVGDPATYKLPYSARLVQDKDERTMVLFSSHWEKEYGKKENPNHQLLDYA